MAFRQETVRIADCTITLKRGGAGPQLLYLHGANGAAVVQPFMESLAEEWEVLVPEHPGFGASEEPPWLDNIHDLAYFYLEFLEAQALSDVTLIGSSLGGWVALEMAVRCSHRLRAMTLVAPAGIHVGGLGKPDSFMWTPEEKVRKLFHDPAIAEKMLARTASPQELEIALKNQFTVARLAWEPRFYDPHLSKWLRRVKLPTQIIWGENDEVLPAGYAAELKKLIAHARVDYIAKCGHLPQSEKPQEFLALFRAFAKR